jgi:hypothetical protein
MTKFKPYQVEKTIDGIKYVAQFNGVEAALRAVDEWYIDGTNITSVEKLNKYMLDNVIVEPHGLTPDDFDSVGALSAVREFAQKVMQGELKPAEKAEK